VVLLVLGVVIFVFKDNYAEKNSEYEMLGYVIIGVSLLFDGFLGATQDRMRSISKPTALHFMQYVYFWGAILPFIATVAMGEFMEFINFSMYHRHSIWMLTIVTVFATVGQLFLNAMLASFGALPLAVVTTTRKFFTVLMSVILLGSRLSNQQWLGTIIIFSALFGDVLFGKKSSKVKEVEKETDEKKEVGEKKETTEKKEVEVKKEVEDKKEIEITRL